MSTKLTPPLSAEGQSFKRIFMLLYLLKDEFAWQVKNQKLPDKIPFPHGFAQHKSYLAMLNKNHQSVCAIIHNLHLAAKSKASHIIIEEMTSERIKDLHVGIDTLLDIQNIEEVMTVIKASMIPNPENKE